MINSGKQVVKLQLIPYAVVPPLLKITSSPKMIYMIHLHCNCSLGDRIQKSQPQHNILNNKAGGRVIFLSRIQSEFLAAPMEEIQLLIDSLSHQLPSQRKENRRKRKEKKNPSHHCREFQAQIVTVASVLLLFVLAVAQAEVYILGWCFVVSFCFFFSSLKHSIVPTFQDGT